MHVQHDKGINEDYGENNDDNKKTNFQYKQQILKCSSHDHIHVTRLNPLSPNSDQDQFSPNNIHTMSRDKI